MTIFELNDKIQSFDVNVALKKAVKDNEHIIVDTIAEKQMYEKGIDGRGESIGGGIGYAPKTIDYKIAKGQPTDRITLRDTGDFHAGMFVDEGKMEVSSTDEKTEKLTNDWGKEILELTKENRAEITDEYLTPSVTNSFWDSLQK